MIAMKATKAFRYSTRRLLPGDHFEVKSERDARLLSAIRKAERRRAPADVPPPPPAVAEKIAAAVAPSAPADVPPEFVEALRPDAIELTAARADYEAAFGKRAFHGWSAEVLRQKIAEKADED